MRIITKILVVSLVSMLSTIALAQQNSITLAQTIGGADWDFGHSIATDVNGNIYTVGSYQGTVDFDKGPSTFNKTSAGGADIFIMKVNSIGEFQWVKSIGGTSSDEAMRIMINPSNNLVIAGIFSGTLVDFDPGSTTYSLSSAGSTDIFVLELDTTGLFVMAQSFGGTQEVFVKDLAIDATGNIYTCGYFYGTVDFDPSPTTSGATSAGSSSDIFIHKMSSTGTLIWAYGLGDWEPQTANSIAVSDNGNVYFAGEFSGMVDFNPSPTVSNYDSTGIEAMPDVFIEKLNAAGQFQWVKSFGAFDGERVNALAIDEHENVYITGDFFTQVDFDPGVGTYFLSSHSGNDVYLQKLNKHGDFVWAKSYGGNSADMGMDIYIDNSGNVFTTGKYSSSTIDINPNTDTMMLNLRGTGGEDVYIQQLDTNGVFKWATSFGSSWFDDVESIVGDDDGNLFVMGSFEGDTLNLNSSISDVASGGGNDGYFVKYETTKAKIEALTTIFLSPPFNVQFINNTKDTNGITWFWNFDDGGFSPDFEPPHTYAYNGTYEVALLAINPITQVVDTANLRIVCSGGPANPCNFTAEILQKGTDIICPTDSFKLSTNSGSYSYNWYLNGIPLYGNNDSIFYAKSQGFYLAVVSNATCSQVSNFYMLANYPTVTPYIQTSGVIAPCSKDSVTLTTTSNYVSYMWNTGSPNISITTKLSGRYTVEGTDQHGCKHLSLETVLNASLANVPDICIVGFDGNTNSNVIVWDAINNGKIDSVYIYKESHIANQYDLIGARDVNGLNYFKDPQSNVSVRQYRYRIAVLDTCGTLSPTSNFHTNIHLLVSAALNNHWNLRWRPYIGVPVSSYKIYRGVDSLNMSLLTTVSGSAVSYTDFNNPAGNVYYMIEAVTNPSCSVFNVPKSNTFNTVYASGVGIENVKNKDYSVKLYPNPNHGHFYLDINGTSEKSLYLSVYSPLGKEVHFQKLQGSKTLLHKVQTEGLSKGIYFIRLSNDEGIVYSSKIIVQ